MIIEEIAKKIEGLGGKLYLVGGAIRDTFLEIEKSDEDYCVTGISLEEFKELFPESKLKGKSFAVFELEDKEFALARKEIKRGEGHKNFEIITGKEITIEEDLKRRDITINSIAQDVLTKKIIDPFNGVEDIKNKIIRATSKSFKEDPLRVYRVARMAANLNFEIELNTLKMMTELKQELTTLSKERVFSELKKALDSRHPEIFFETLKYTKILEIHFKEISDLIGAKQPKQYHPEGDAYNHTMLALKNSVKLTENTVIRFCTLVHDLGKGRTPKTLYPHHYNHTKLGIEPLKKLADRLGIPNEWYKCAETAILEHMRGGNFNEMTPAKKVSFLERLASSRLGLDGLQIVVYADRCRDENQENIMQETFDFAKIGKKMIKEIDGRYIEENYKIKQGIKFGKKLHEERVKWMKENDRCDV